MQKNREMSVEKWRNDDVDALKLSIFDGGFFFILLRQSLVSQQFLGSIGSLFLLLVVGNVVEILLISNERRDEEKMEEKLDKHINVKNNGN